MAPSPPHSSQTGRKVNENNDDVFQDASDSSLQPELSLSQDPQSGVDKILLAMDPYKGIRTTESSHATEDAMEENYGRLYVEDDEGRIGYVISAIEHKRLHLERALQLEQFRQRNPNIPTDQLEQQFDHLKDVIIELPHDLAQNPLEYRRRLVESGINETLIQQQMNDLAYFNAQQNLSTATRDRATSPIPSSQQLAGTPKRAGDQDNASAGPGQAVSLNATASMLISALEVVTPGGETVFSLSPAEIQQAMIDPATKVLRVEVLRSSGAAHGASKGKGEGDLDREKAGGSGGGAAESGGRRSI